MSTSTDSLQQRIKTFWDRPEGTTGKVMVGALVLGGAGLIYKYLPIVTEWMVNVLNNMVHTVLLGGALVVLTAPIWNSKVRALTGYMARSVLRSITAMFIEIDPIGILKSYVEDLKKNLSKMDKQIGNLGGQLKHLKTIIDKNADDREESLRLAAAANKKGSKAAFTLQARRAGRREKSNMTLQALFDKMTALLKLLSKLREVSDVTVQDMEDEVQTKEQERKAILAGYGAFSSALKILKGDPDKRALFDQAMEYLNEDYAKKVGEIEDFMRVSEGFIASVDLENELFDEDALRALDEKLDMQSDQLLTTVDRSKNRVSIPDEDEEKVPVAVGVRNLYK